MQEILKGRGSQFNLPNRFEQIYIDQTSDEYDEYFEIDEEERKVQTVFYNDNSKCQ